jgi:D-alanine--poly(phosphoribitol) ligase subunit 1
LYNVLSFLEESINKFPQKVAVVCENDRLTYKELGDYAKVIGSFLISKESVRTPIIVFMDKKIDTLLAFLGIVYAGCPYSLVNPEFPKTRILDIAKVLGSNVVVTDKEHMELAQELFKDLLVLDIEDIKKGDINLKGLEIVREEIIDYDPLYINFTSGSTGMPKGVCISHRSVIDFIGHFTKLFKITNEDIMGNQAPFDFDVSVKDIYSCLFTGATLVIIPKSYFSSPAKLLDYLVDNKITTLVWAVSALCLITTFHGLQYKVPSDVNKIIFSGEVMPIKHLKMWMDSLPLATFINVYGPTEITCNCTYHIIDRNRDYEEVIPIGKHFPNEKVMLLDDELKEVKAPGVLGGIYVGGTALALGYYNDTLKTDASFIKNPNVVGYNEVMYNTGDLGKYNELGEIVFCGRKDFQIKYQGHRIELEEIEKAIMKIDGVIRACVIFLEEKSKLYGFYIGDILSKDLHSALKEMIPSYMIPTKLIAVKEFPMSKNGKIDRKKLLEEGLK